MPPALSEIGPKPSIVKAVVKVESIPIAAKAIPYMFARANETKMLKAMQKTGMTQLL